MWNVWKRRRKTMGATATLTKTRSDAEKHDIGKKRSFFDFFRKSRHWKKSKINDREESSADQATNIGEQTTGDEVEDRTESGVDMTSTGAETSTTVEPPETVLTEIDVRTLFSGAPQFSGQSTYGRAQVSASFPWNLELKTRDVSDAKAISHAAFSGSTLRQHLPQIRHGDDKDTLSYHIGLVELPSMLASTGNEPGTVGLGFFVEEPDADILNINADLEENPSDVFNNFNNFELLESQPEKLGIRKFDFSIAVERLVDLSSVYESTSAHERGMTILNRSSSGDLYAALFGKILTPPKYDNSTTDPTGIKVQIETLIRILNLKRVWYDFSNVEWRIRIGQLLFSEGHSDMADSNLSEPEDGLSERDVVLLQLLLACELYSRLEAVASLSAEEVKSNLNLTAEEVSNFRELESRKSRWDLVLAKRFLENIDAKTFVRPKFVAQSEKSLARTLLGMAQRESLVQLDELDIAFEPRRQEVQLEGLFHFAEALEWPNVEALRQHMNAALAVGTVGHEPASPSIYATPLSTPGTMTPRSFRSDRESGYFAGAPGSASPEMSPRSFQLQPPSRLDLNASMPDASENTSPKPSIGGWLTRSYMTGLILPGEAICHLLISALLENDAESIATLGDNANLYGGFVYKDRSYWSKSCVLGRTLACMPGSKECMGWVSSPIVPDGCSDGWLDVHSLPTSLKKIKVDDEAFERATNFLAGVAIPNTKFADLTLPQDSAP